MSHLEHFQHLNSLCRLASSSRTYTYTPRHMSSYAKISLYGIYAAMIEPVSQSNRSSEGPAMLVHCPSRKSKSKSLFWSETPVCAVITIFPFKEAIRLRSSEPNRHSEHHISLLDIKNNWIERCFLDFFTISTRSKDKGQHALPCISFRESQSSLQCFTTCTKRP